MNKLKTTKYMKIFTNIGYVIGFLMILGYSVFGGSYTIPIIGVIIIFLGRTVGYGIDRLIEYKEDRESNRG